MLYITVEAQTNKIGSIVNGEYIEPVGYRWIDPSNLVDNLNLSNPEFRIYYPHPWETYYDFFQIDTTRTKYGDSSPTNIYFYSDKCPISIQIGTNFYHLSDLTKQNELPNRWHYWYDTNGFDNFTNYESGDFFSETVSPIYTNLVNETVKLRLMKLDGISK